jgi:hypothetical protein
MVSKKDGLILAGLLVGGVGLASMMVEADGGDAPLKQIRERAGKILGGETTTTTTTGGETKKESYTQPDVFFAAFPTDEDVFGVVESQDKPAAQRGGGGMTSAQRTAYDIMAATAMRGGVYTPSKKEKKEPYDPSLLAIAPAGVAGKGAIQAAAGVEAQRISGAGVAGGSAITSFLKDVGSLIGGAPSRISTAGVAGKGAISSAVRGVTGISKKYDYMGTGMTQSEYKSQFAERTYSTSPTGEVVKPKKYPTATAAQMESTAARRAAFETVTKFSKKQPVK